MAWYIYLLRCGDGSLYTGITTDPDRRLKRHNAGQGSRYVRSRGLASLVYLARCRNHLAARRRELEIQSWTRNKKLQLIARAAAAR